jgi:hypothetical protein
MRERKINREDRKKRTADWHNDSNRHGAKNGDGI